MILGYFDVDTKAYRRNPVQEQVEVVSLVGDITRSERSSTGGTPSRTIHAHVVVARADGTALGGHLLGAHVVRPSRLWCPSRRHICVAVTTP